MNKQKEINLHLKYAKKDINTLESENKYAQGGGVGGTFDSSGAGETIGGTLASSESGEMIGGTMASSMYKKGGGVGNEGIDCIDFIKNTEAIANNGYYHYFENTDVYVSGNDAEVPRIKSLCLVTYNSGAQKNLKVVDTINTIGLSNKLHSIIGGDKSVSRIILNEFMTNAKRLTKSEISKLKGKKIIIADRDDIVCTNTKYAEGGGVAMDENRLMVMNNNRQIAHHTQELSSAVKKSKHIPAWVVSKVGRSASDLSDATHYLEGAEEQYAEGGNMPNGFEYSIGGL